MDKNSSHKIIKDTLESAFNKERFLLFTKNLLNHIDEEKAFHAHGYVPEVFKNYVKTYERLGTYTDPEGKKMDVLIVYLQKESSLERARTAQRNFVARYLKDRDQKDGGLVAFVSPNSEDWRFSLIKMEYKFTEGKNGKVKVKEEFTPARRWSFLVGANESSHTAKSRLAPVVQEDEHNPPLKILEEAFNIEQVTREFFEKYRELFLRVKETLDETVKKDSAIRKDFGTKGVDTVDFAKKLLGQIVFLYFLQKKGWFGVARDASWGSGPKNFLRQLFEKKHGDYKNFFNDILEPLFYEALAVERSKDFYSRFNCKIPFLNGGLFDPINNYDWVHTDVLLPNDLFSNDRRTEQGDIGDGILDVFDRYNFTVKEDEPLEKEVAVDPEMLGKVFENLLEVKDRKSKGTYYTPREIVHYMCVQSLVNYLVTELDGKASKDDLEQLIKYGDAVGENEARVEEKGEETQTYYYKLPESIRSHAKLIDEQLADIKVCDPAIGSGAFPVGMMTEIVRARNVLSSYIKASDRTLYNFKRDCIQNSLYGVDIDPSAVEIAKLRLWLSLIVDEDDIKQIKPLPNLDYKIMQGNSLLEEFEGVKLFDEKLLAAPDLGKYRQVEKAKAEISKLQKEYIDLHSQGKLTDSKKQELNLELKKLNGYLSRLTKSPKTNKDENELFDAPSKAKEKANELKSLHKEFFEATQKSRKEQIKKRIETLEWELIEETLKEQGKRDSLSKLEQYKRANTKPFFLWKLNFAEIFGEKGGFDVVIANPPYIFGGNALISAEEKISFKKNYFSGSKKINLFTIFIERGSNLLHPCGFLTYIVPNTLLRVTSYDKIREYLVKRTTIQDIVDLDVGIFEKVTASTIVISLKNIEAGRNHAALIKRGIYDQKPITLNQSVFEKNGYIFDIFSGSEERELIEKFSLDTTPLESLCTYIRFGVVITKNINEVVATVRKSNQWKRFLEGDEIGRYYINYRGRYLNYSPERLHRSRTPDVFESPKIMIQRITGGISPLKATFDEDSFYNKESIINVILKNPGNPEYKYVLAVLNSSLINWFYRKKFTNDSKLTVNLSKEYLGQIPIKLTNGKLENEIVSIVDKILSTTSHANYFTDTSKQQKVLHYEQQINKLIYQLYGLTPQEIKTVEGSADKAQGNGAKF